MKFDPLSFGKMLSVTALTGASADAVLAPSHITSTPSISIVIVAAALIGSTMSLCFGERVLGWRHLFPQILASSVFGVAISVLAIEAFKWHWAQNNVALFVLLVSAMTRWFLPTVIQKVQTLILDFRRTDNGD